MLAGCHGRVVNIRTRRSNMLDVNLINLLFMSDTIILRLSPVSDIFPWRLSKLCITLLKSCAKGLTTVKFLRIDVAPPNELLL
jgi:hypothetical protein